MIDSKQHTFNIQLQQADKQYEISKAHLMQVWSLLTRRSVDVDKIQHHLRIGSLNARIAQEQYNTLLIAHSENSNILRQYSVLMRDLYGEDRFAIEMLCEDDLMKQENKIDLLQNEDELGQNNDIWGVDAEQTNQQQQEGEQNQNEDQDGINQTEGGKQLQNSDSLSDGNSPLINNKSKSASDVIYLQDHKNTNFISDIDAGRAERDEILIAEYVNIAFEYSRYYMFNILTLDQDTGSELDAIYEEAYGVTYPLLIGVGPDMEITKSTSDELRLTRYILWVEDAINVMLQLFTYNPEDTTHGRGYFYTMKQQLAVITLIVPFAATEEMKIVSHSAHKVVQSSSDISIIVVMCFVVATLIMIIGLNILMRLEISKIIKDRKAKIRLLCNVTVEKAQKMYTLMQDRNDPNERKRIKRKKKRGDGNQTQRSGGTDETHSTASGASGASGGSIASNRSGKSGSSEFKKRALNKRSRSKSTMKSGESKISLDSGASGASGDNKMGQSKDPMLEKLQQMQQGQDAQQGAQHLGMDPDMHQGIIHPGMMDYGTYGYSTAKYQMLGQP
ncbi:MAG: hypothetical protein EZS28_014617 [Streblomastix strix]|uniref:TmcB/TmcC TPR repeats domain-containing protein n=1 Tax=Streblomastix strix TaxID=222440 RepID=A0A5J4W5G0_9EUKA|nr:MAG: hypothetical protein EZS28_014617 [Streblomastix strix]